MYNVSKYNIPKQAGWICPICGRVMAPTMVECIHCNREPESITNTKIRPIEDVITTSYDGAQCTCEGNSKEEDKVDYLVKDSIKPSIKIRKLNKDGNLVDEKNMTREELKKIDSILEKVIGDFADVLKSKTVD